MSKVCALLAVAFVVPGAFGQSVIAARAGIINFFEGVVFLDGQPLQHKPGVFNRMQEGSLIATEGGRAEVLLSPDTYLRLGADTSIRIISTEIDNTKIELLYGSIILDSAQAPAGALVKIIFKGDIVHPVKPGNYRLDTDPPLLRVFKGEAEVSRAEEKNGKPPVAVIASQMMPLSGSTVVKRLTQGTDSLLDIWSEERGSLIASKIVDSQSITDPLFDRGPAVPDDLAAYIGYASAPLPSALGLSTYGSGVGYPAYPGYGYPGYAGYPVYSAVLPDRRLTTLLIPAYPRPASLSLFSPRTAYTSSVFTGRPGYTGHTGGIGISSLPRPTVLVPRPATAVPQIGMPARAAGHR